MANLPKRVRWIGSSKKDLKSLPEAVWADFGYALWEAQDGQVSRHSRILKGFGGASVLEIRTDQEGNAYRAVYTVRFAEFVYVLHVFQKKSKKGIKTPPEVMELVRKRLKMAEEDYAQWKETKGDRN